MTHYLCKCCALDFSWANGMCEIVISSPVIRGEGSDEMRVIPFSEMTLELHRLCLIAAHVHT